MASASGVEESEGASVNFTPHTRGNTSEKNKPKAFLFASPEDGEAREALVELLLDMTFGANLCVWTADVLPRQDALERLSDVSLFVMAVTERLAGTETEAAAQAVRFCYEKKIPLLPVYYISPSGSTEPAGSFYRAASAAMGKLDGRLELDGPRQSASDFREQFSRKLHNLVMPDAVAEEIRDHAFRKQIFLSYRKKDREQALKVMKAIHDLPLCEALAIWFDDFLIAGRDFNEEIFKQLQASDAFALTVTDSLTEADRRGRKNYVQREEWPRAAQSKQEDKRILIEAEATDRERLAKDMDPPVTATVPVGDSEALRNAIVRASLLDDMGDAPTARQKYLLGMAYLSGIRVEKDTERALRLLTEAANAGSADAALQLGFMYLARVGVERDNEAARRWKTTAFDLAEEQFNAGDASALELAHSAAFGSDGLVLMEYATDHPQKGRDICRRMRAMLIRAPESGNSAVRLAQTWLDESQIHFEKPATLSQETLAEHRKSVEMGIEILNDQLVLDDEGKYQLAGGYGELGSIAQWQGNWDEAERYFLRGKAILEKLVERTGDIVYRRSLAGFWNALGNLYKRRMDFEKAREAFAEGVSLSEAICAERGLPNDEEGLAIALSNYAGLHEDHQQGTDMMDRAVKLLEKTAEEDAQDPYLQQELEEFRSNQRKLKNRPRFEKLFKWGIILILVGALAIGLWSMLKEIMA